MAMRRNLLRERLNAGKPTVGTHILSAWPTLVELIGHSKQYDYVEFTGAVIKNLATLNIGLLNELPAEKRPHLVKALAIAVDIAFEFKQWWSVHRAIIKRSEG